MISQEHGFRTLTVGGNVLWPQTFMRGSITKTGNFAESTRQVVNKPGSIFFTAMLEMPQPDIHALKWSAILSLLSLLSLSWNWQQMTAPSSH